MVVTETVEVTGGAHWREYVETIIDQCSDDEIIDLYGIESNTESDDGEKYIVEIQRGKLSKTIEDFHRFQESAGYNIEELTVEEA